ncbi:hypothetical protein JJO78_20185 [Marinobacter sp. DS40M6]|nr:hypothetical protein [Marinobacter sp. DS40M6]
MNRRKFERFAEKQGLPLERLYNDTRYMSMETEWAWRGYCEKAEETRIASSTVNHLCNRAKPFMTRRNLGRFRQVIKDTVLTDGLVPFDGTEADYPTKGSRWCRADNTFDPSKGEYNGYTVEGVTNTEHLHENHEPQVVYRGDNGFLWSLPITRWPGNLQPEQENTNENYQ